MSIEKLLCPITQSELVYIGYDEGVMDGNSYYSPASDSTIIFAVHPFSTNIYTQVESASYTAKDNRYFKLLEDRTWQELKRVPHGDGLFPINQNDTEWDEACAKALIKYEAYVAKEKYWDEHPNEDPRIRAKTIANDSVQVVPMSAPSSILFFLDYHIGDPATVEEK